MLSSNIIRQRSYIDKAIVKAEHNYSDFNKNYSLSIIVPEFQMPIIDGAIADTTNNFLIEPKEF